MSLFGGSSTLAILSSLSDFELVQITENFSGSPANWEWATPGTHDPQQAWEQITGSAGSIGATGPTGGANPSTGAVEASNPRAYTEASTGSGPWSLELKGTFNTSQGAATLDGHVHMRFGTEGGISDGTLEIQGWNGSSWVTVQTITGSQQSSPGEGDISKNADYILFSSLFSVTSAGLFTNADFTWRLLATKGAGPSPNYDFNADNLIATGFRDTGGTPAPDIDLRAALFNTGNRRLHVHPSGGAPLDGSTPDLTFTTPQAAFAALQGNDVLTVAAGRYPGTLTKSNVTSGPVWIAAEVPGTVEIDHLWQDARTGDETWSLENSGTGRYSAPHGDVYCGHFVDSEGNEHFLPRYKSIANLDATTLTGLSAGGSSASRTKPAGGMAFSGGRIHIRLPGGVNPNGKNIFITEARSGVVVTFNNCDNFIFDGFEVSGGGTSPAILFDSNCANPTIMNCKTGHSRFMASSGSNLLCEWNTYTLRGFPEWMEEVVTLNNVRQAFFHIVKSDTNGLAEGGNAILEGGMVKGSGSVQTACEFRFNYIYGVMDGQRLGEFTNSTSHHNIGHKIGDDFIQFEDDVTSNDGDNCRAFFDYLQDIHGPAWSHQNQTVATHTVMRNIVVITDPSIYAPQFYIKLIRLIDGSTIRYAHNYIEIRGGTGPTAGQTQAVWYPFSTPEATGKETGGDAISSWNNNIIMGVGATFITNSGGSPGTSGGNVSVGNSGVDQYRVSGVDAGSTEGALQLNADFTPQGGSPVLGVGVALPGGITDDTGLETGAGSDAGPWPEGHSPTVPPRAFGDVFLLSGAPERWTSPGA